MKTSTERVARMRKKRAALGLRRVDVYVHQDDVQRIKDLEARLNKKRSQQQ